MSDLFEMLDVVAKIVGAFSENREVTRGIAKIIRNLYCDLVTEGFSPEEAIDLIKALGGKKS